MRWTSGGSSEDIEDHRGDSPGGGGGFNLLGGRPLGIVGILLVLAASFIFKTNFFSLLSGGGGNDTSASAPANAGEPSRPVQSSPQEDKLIEFVTFVINDVQGSWSRDLPAQAEGVQYTHAKLALFRRGVRSGCGFAESTMGPFYCPVDRKVYLDLGFFDELRTKFGAPGQFAEAYVIAHEVGHHVQNVLGIEAKVRRAREARPADANALSVRMELQADCLAGVWAHSTEERKLLEQGDVESGLKAAAAVGDDRLQKQATGQVHPESWTHGSSEQRVGWFKRGMQSGRVSDCDTFAGSATP